MVSLTFRIDAHIVPVDLNELTYRRMFKNHRFLLKHDLIVDKQSRNKYRKSN
jgi:hypothetical protein